MAESLAAQEVRDVVMESTAQYWKPVWRQLEGQCRLHLAQAQSNRAPRGRKGDFRDAERLARRHVAGELILRFVPDPEQRLWRTLTRTKYQLTRDRVRPHSQLACLLDDARNKLGTCVSDLLGVSSRRILEELADGQTDPQALAALVEPDLRAAPEQLADALSAAPDLSILHRQILRLFLDRVNLIERQMAELHQAAATALQAHQAAVVRLAAVPGLGVDSAQQVFAEVGPAAATFASPGLLGGGLSGARGVRRSIQEQTQSQRHPHHAARAESGGQCGPQDQGEHIPEPLSPLATQAVA